MIEEHVGKDSRIEWTHHTFNPWWGCVKVSEACKHCYAETWAKRVGQKVWGPTASRRFFGEAHWKEPFKWDREAGADGERRRVFCASMADVFEDRIDLADTRKRLWPLIEATPNLDWLLLTKRPENVRALAGWDKTWPENVWLGTTVENQETAKLRIPEIAAIPAKVRFLSCEPLIGELKIRKWLPEIHWVIAGGESGPHARPSDPAWFRSLRDQCIAGGTAFHFKQWGNWAPEAPDDKKVDHKMVRLSKKNAGRSLDGRTWDELPI